MLDLAILALAGALPAVNAQFAGLISNNTAAIAADPYVPKKVDSCPSSLVRMATKGQLSSEEQTWLSARNEKTQQSLADFLAHANLDGVNATDYVNSTIAVAVSGGGYRAMLVGAGMISGMDNRTTGAWEHGLGGLLESSTYLAGLSGGSWVVGSLAMNNWTSVQDIIDGQANGIWDLSKSYFDPSPAGSNLSQTFYSLGDIVNDVQFKLSSGLPISITDVWGRLLSYKLLSQDNVFAPWSSIADSEVFQNADMPFPLTVADGRYPGTIIVGANATVFETNPFELGSWDPTLGAFSQVKYLGTKVFNGMPQGQCLTGFDNAGFVMGTSASLFNGFAGNLESFGLIPGSLLYSMIGGLFDELQEFGLDVALYGPNPFFGLNVTNSTNGLTKSGSLYLVDGGEDGEGIPFVPLLQKEREVDVIFAVDADSDAPDSYPGGSALGATYERQFTPQGANIAFPPVPPADTIVRLGLNKRPTFFGCDARNMTDLAYIPPLVVYLPNVNYTFPSNTSTFQLSYSEAQRNGMIQNGFEAVTRNNMTDDSEWLQCVACAIIRREQEATNQTQSDQCQKCFKQYCWDGTVLPALVNASNASNASNSTHLPKNKSHKNAASSAKATTGLAALVAASLAFILA